MHALLASLPLTGLPEQVTSRLAWVLVHFVWQGAAVALLLALTLWLGRVKRPSVRYACGLIALAVMVACPIVTFGLVRPVLDAENSEPWDQAKVAIIAPRDEPFADGRSIAADSSRGAMMATLKGSRSQDSLKFEAEEFGSEILEPQLLPAHRAGLAIQPPDASVEPFTNEGVPARSGWSRVQPWIVSGWLLGVASLSLRLLLGWLGVWRLRRRVEPVPEWLAARVTSLAQALRVTRPLIHLSHRVTEAVAVGSLKPMILLPVAWVTELQPDMIEAVIAHELAHIRRGDLWVNLIQRLVETLLFYHPAVWWLSRQLRIDRELCCDELVVRTLHNPLRYAETLEHVGRLSLADTVGLARQSLATRTSLTVSIGSPRHILLARIRAILTPPQQDRSTTAWLAGLIPLAVVCLIGWSVASQQVTPANAEPSSESSPTTNVSPSEEPDRTSPSDQGDTKGAISDAAAVADAIDSPNEAGTVERVLDEMAVQSRQRIRAALDEQTEILFTETPLTDALRFLEDLHAIKIVLDEAARPGLANRDQVTLTIEGAELRFALSQLLTPLGLTYMFADDHLLVTTPDEIRRRGGTPPDDGAALLQKLKDKYPSVRWYELRRGEPLLPDDLSTMREVLNGLSDADPAIQVEACRVIGQFKDSAKDAVPRLEKLAQQTDIRTKQAAYSALARIGAHDLSTLPFLLAGLERSDAVAAGNLDRLLSATHQSATAQLIAAYQVGTPFTRKALLRRLNLNERHAAGLVQLGLAETDAELRSITLSMLASALPRALLFSDYVVQVRPFLGSPIRMERSLAASWLIQVPEDAEAAVRVLIDEALAVGTQAERSQSFVVLTMMRSGESRRLVAQQLKERIATDLQAKWMEAAGLVIQLTPDDATDIIEKLAQRVRENAADAASAADVLANGHKLSNCESALTKLLAEVPVETRLNLARAAVPAPDRTARSALHLRLLDDPDPAVIRQTIESMLRDSVAAPALPKLQQLAESGPDAIRETARNAADSLTMPQPPPLKPREARSNKWGTATRDGLRTQIALRTADHAVGKLLIVSLFVKNESNQSRVVSKGQVWDPLAFEIIGPDGKAVPSMNDLWHPDSMGEVIEPGEVWRLAEAGLNWEYLLEHPGRYAIRFVGRDDKPKEQVVGENRITFLPPNVTLLPASNRLTIDLAPGTLTDRAATFVRLRAIAPAGWKFSAYSTGDFSFQPPADTSTKSLPELTLRFSNETSAAHATPKPGDPPVERLGPTKLGHAFLTLPPETKAAWPLCVEAIRAQLPVERGKAADAPATRNEGDAKIDKQESRQEAIARGVQFLKSQQHEDGTWNEFKTMMTGGTTALALVALVQAGVKADDAVLQKALTALRTVEPTRTYVVALQTMAFCTASPTQDAELIRRNVAWIERSQKSSGAATGAWSYGDSIPPVGGDNSNTRFAVMALDAAQRAGFEVKLETWQRVAEYWLKAQQEGGGWGYTTGTSREYFSMTLAGVACLATAHHYLPKDDQSAVRETALRKPQELIAKGITAFVTNDASAPRQASRLYACQCLERAGHLTDTARFGDVEWKSVVTKLLLDHQRHNGAWSGPSTAENELIATSFALMFLSGRPEDRGDGKVGGGAKPIDEKEQPKEEGLRSEPRRGQETRAEPKPGQTGHGVMLTVRGRVRIDGPIPVVPPLKIKPTFRAIIPRNREEDLRNEVREQAAPIVEIPDDSLVISKEGGVANVAIYLKKAPAGWKHSAPPSDPIVIEAIEHRFSPHMAFIRTGQSLTVKNSMSEATNFHSYPLRGSQQNYLTNVRGESLIKSPYTQSESLPNRFVSDVHPWMQGYVIALDHPFAAITDADGRFEIRDLPPGEHHFIVWHERRGYLNKDLVVLVEGGEVTEVDLKYTAEQLERRDDATFKAQQTGVTVLPEHSNLAVVKLVKKFGEHFAKQRFAEAEIAAKQAKELDPLNPKLDRLRKIAAYARRLASGDGIPQVSSSLSIEFVGRLIQRGERHAANDRESAAKFVGRWKLTVSARHVSDCEFKQADDGSLLLTGLPANHVFPGRFALIGKRLELVETSDTNIHDFVWQVKSNDRLTLIVDDTRVGGKYLGATLERIAAP